MSNIITAPISLCNRDEAIADANQAKSIIDFLAKAIDPAFDECTLNVSDLYAICLILETLSTRMAQLADKIEAIKEVE